jgi:formate dehydrogenase subunit delta
MLNDIGAFFAHENTPEEQAQGVLTHIKRYWDPRMKARIIEHYRNGADGLCGHVRAAVGLLVQEQQGKISP